MIDLRQLNSLNDIARALYNKANYTNREKSKKYLKELGIDWKVWLEEKKQQKKRYCKNCGKELKGDQYSFCSRSCSATFNNKKRNSHKELNEASIKPKKVKLDKKCLFCGNIINSRNKFFCSNLCQLNYQKQQYLNNWKLGLESGLSGEFGISSYIRNYLLNKSNYKCELCGWGEINTFTNKIPLEIHHKDGNYLNNSEDNLQVLCPNCHSLTETFKSHNKNGRKSRTKYR